MNGYSCCLLWVNAATIAAVTVATAAISAHADTVDDLVVFTAGTTASADEVNANFREVADAVNGNDGLIAELSTEVAELSENVANCDMLREALTGIDGVAAHPVRIKLDRGDFDCGSTPLTMKNFVTIEGAGRNLTTIIGDVGDSEQGVVNGADDAVLRHLSVEHRAAGSLVAVAIQTRGSRMSLIDVAIKVDSTTVPNLLGISAPGGSLNLTNVSIQTINTNGGG